MINSEEDAHNSDARCVDVSVEPPKNGAQGKCCIRVFSPLSELGSLLRWDKLGFEGQSAKARTGKAAAKPACCNAFSVFMHGGDLENLNLNLRLFLCGLSFGGFNK